MATISACAVGSLVRVTRFVPLAMMRPSLTITAAKGPPLPERTFSSASAMARFMKSGDIYLFSCRVSDCTVRPKFATQHFSNGQNHSTPGPAAPHALRPPDLQENGLAVGWSIALHGFATIFVQ